MPEHQEWLEGLQERVVQEGQEARLQDVGANGTQLIFSKGLANGKVGTRTWRIDVENPAPGVRPGSLHVQLNDVTGATRYEYARGGKFKTKDGEKLPSKIQNDIDNDPEAQTGIRKGLGILNEKW